MNQDKTRIIVPAQGVDPYQTRHSSVPVEFEEKKGACFGDCVIEHPLGMGGAAAVYLAKHQKLEVLRAIKVLKGQFRNDSQFKKRFLKEAKLVAGLDHPAIVRIHTVGEADGKPFIEMEWIDGTSLRRLFEERGAMPPAVAVAIAEQVAHALAYAHTAPIADGAGVVHRDIKPENILVQKDGRIKLVDFGIARTMESSNDTVAGTIIGTLHYMSPEQIDGRNADARSDLYSLSVVLYEMLTGFAPFTAATFTAIIKKISEGRYVSLKRVNPRTARIVSDIVRKGLRSQAEERFQTATELSEAFRALRVRTRLDPDQIVREWLFSGKAPDLVNTRKRIRYFVYACLFAGAAGLYFYADHNPRAEEKAVYTQPVMADSAVPIVPVRDTLSRAVPQGQETIIPSQSLVRKVRVFPKLRPIAKNMPRQVQSPAETRFEQAAALDQRYRRGEVELRDAVRGAWQTYIKEYSKDPASEKFVSDAKKRLLYIINN